MITFDGVTYTYPEARAPVLDNLHLEIREGDFVLSVGPSGSGKSTLLRCLNGLIPHFYGGEIGGTIRIAGRDPIRSQPRQMSSVVGFVFQDPETQFVMDTVENELAFGMENHNLPQTLMRKRLEEVLDQLNIADLRDRRISTLSGGEKQRVAIASVLTLQPRVLVLDEPTSQLDPQAAEEVLTALRRLNLDLGLTIVLSEHRLERVVQYADRMVYLPAPGEAPIQGPPEEVLRRMDLVPPLVALGKALGWSPLPFTIKEARPKARDLALEPPPAVDEETTVPDAPLDVAVRDLWFAYDGQMVLRGLDLEIHRGECVAIMGRNGSGKTTLLKHLVGLLKPGRGSVRVRDMDTASTPLEEIIRVVGYVPQNPDTLLFADTVEEEVTFTRQNHDLPAEGSQELLQELGLAGAARRYPRDLSVGERQRVALASILAAEPDIILLDEPTRGLDYIQKGALVDYLWRERAAGHTVLLSTHDVELVASAVDRVIILGEGEVIIDGGTREVMSQSMVFSSQINKLLRDERYLTVEDVLRSLP